jgi:tetratricopeptide (TPR) repeat protein
LRRSLERSGPRDSIVRKAFALLVSCHRALGQAGEAASACSAGLRLCPDDPELLFQEGILLRERGDRAGAERALVRLLTARPAPHFASVDAGLTGYKARHNLAVLCHEQGRLQEAAGHWRQALAERPDFLQGWVGVGELGLKRLDWATLEETARRMEALPGGPAEAAILRARGHMARREFGPARALLARQIAEAPQALGPRVILSHALLQEGTDLDAAEKALRDVLALDPNERSARENLALLLRNRQARADLAFQGNVTLAQLYEAACRQPSDIHEHLPTLYRLAKECRHVTEMGTGAGVSTAALLYAQPKKLVCYDRVRYPQVDRLAAAAGATELVFREQDVLWADVEETDLLFIDTWHVYGQLQQELALHAGKVRRYIVLHETTTFGEKGEDEGHKGLWPAVEAFLEQGTFRLKQRFENNNGLTILEAVGADA